MSFRIRCYIASLVLAFVGCGLHAAEIRYVGHQAGVENDADDADFGWRNPKPVKPLDIDGDNILGTDGWALGGKNQKIDTDLPAYVWVLQTAGGAGFGGGKWDSPKDPSGKDTTTERFVYTGNSGSGESFLIKIRGRELDNKILRLGVLYGSSAGKSTITLAQAEGDGRESVTSPPLEHDGTTLDVAFFNISGARDGDVFRISTAGPRLTQVAGLTFDTADAGLAAIKEPADVVRSRYVTPFSVSRIFADHAVIQRDQPVPVWGWADLDTTVKVTFAGQTVSAAPDASGRWMATLQPMKASKTPQVMTVTDGKDTFTFSDLLIGDVWLCSGQSNMEMTFEGERYRSHLPDSVQPADWPVIRQFKVGVKGGDFPQERLAGGSWAVCNEKDYKTFSATAFFFAYTITKETGIPIGIVNSTLGNTRLGSWVAPEGVERVKDHVPASDFRGVFGPGYGNYYGQIAPLAGMALKGFLWYQGEGNNGEGETYFWKMKALIEGWRQVWGREDLPFYFAQLPSYDTKKWNWFNTREAQRKVLTVPHTGMAVLTDVGDNDQPWPVSLHPRNKYEVGRRLALWALAHDYGKKDLVYSGPLFKTATFKGTEAVIAFDHVGSGLMAAKRKAALSIAPPKPVAEVIGFEIAGADKKWASANAAIRGDTIMLTADGVSQPAYARYLVVNNTDHGTLYNKEGLPASPFTTESL